MTLNSFPCCDFSPGVTQSDLLSVNAQGQDIVVDGVLNAVGLVVVRFPQPHLDPLVLDTDPQLLWGGADRGGLQVGLVAVYLYLHWVCVYL